MSTDYAPGDVVNGHTLVQHDDGKMEWLPLPESQGGVLQSAISRLTDDTTADPEGTIWSAVGKIASVVTGRYWLDAEYLRWSKGVLGTDAQHVLAADIADVDVRQSLTQKMRNVYTVVVHAHGNMPILIENVEDGFAAQRTITRVAREAWLTREQRSISIEAQRHEATSTTRQELAYSGGAPIVGAVPASAVTPATDPIAQLKSLGDLHAAGVLTEDEFAAKKAEILSRM